jgi:tetratricopeptide (TPR) repeat protein
MRHLTFCAITAVPAIVLAQAPGAPETYTAKYQRTAPAVDTMLKEFRAKDAQAQIEALLPAEMPKYAMPTLDELKANYAKAFSGVPASLQDYYGLADLNFLLATATKATGDWDKAKVSMEKALQITKDNGANFKLSVAPVRAFWEGLVKMADDFKAKNDEQAKTISAKPTKTPDEEAWMKWYNGNLAMLDGNIANGTKIQAALDKTIGDIDKKALVIADNVAAFEKSIKEQAAEIQKYNEEQKNANPKPKKVVTWVTAVLGNPENIKSLSSDKARVEFLNRLLFLEPNNAKALKVMENIMWARDPFYEEAPKGKGKAKKG